MFEKNVRAGCFRKTAVLLVKDIVQNIWKKN